LDDFARGAVVLFLNDQARGRELTMLFVDGTRLDAVPYQIVATEVPYGMVPTAVMSSETAESMGLRADEDTRYIVRLGHPLTGVDAALAAGLAEAGAEASVQVERGRQRTGDAFRLLILVASLVFALSVTGVAVALGEAEARPDQRTLLSLGADPSVRRRIIAARAGVLAGLAGLLAVPAGLLPIWGILLPREMPLVAPLPEVIGALVILPLAATLGAAILGRPIPQWMSYRT